MQSAVWRWAAPGCPATNHRSRATWISPLHWFLQTSEARRGVLITVSRYERWEVYVGTLPVFATESDQGGSDLTLLKWVLFKFCAGASVGFSSACKLPKNPFAFPLTRSREEPRHDDIMYVTAFTSVHIFLTIRTMKECIRAELLLHLLLWSNIELQDHFLLVSSNSLLLFVHTMNCCSKYSRSSLWQIRLWALGAGGAKSRCSSWTNFQ